jgi:flagellar biosynthesis protein FliR
VDLSLLTVSTVITFMLILFRVSGMLFTAPFFNGRLIPVQLKVGLAFTISLLLFPLHSMSFAIPKDLIQFSVIGAQEIMLGLILGFIADLVFVALQMAGDFISVQIGLSASAIMDPITGSQVQATGQIYFYLGLLLFLSFNAHHLLILAVDHSFNVMPLGHFFDLKTGIGPLSERVLYLTAEMISLSLLIAAPVMGVMVVTETALAFMSKLLPQMNVFMVALPLKIGIGLSTMAICIPYVAELLIRRFDVLDNHLKMLFLH